MTTVSVIVPVYKVEAYLHRCVDSILAQTYSNFELILVDDGSPDNCGAICDEYAAKDSRVVVIHQENGGLSAARNAGIDWAFANSNSQWLTFVDSDDWVHPQMLERLLNAAQQYGSAMSICGYVETTGEEPEFADAAAVLWGSEAFFVEHNVNAIIACGKLYSRESFASIRYPVGKIHEDEFTTYKLLLRQESVPVIPLPLYCYFVNEESITRSVWSAKHLVYFDAAKEQIRFFKRQRKEKAENHVIVFFLELLLKNYRLYREQCQPDRNTERRFRDLARYYLIHYGSRIQTDTERKVNFFWIAFPGLGKLYHKIKRVLKNKK